MERLIATVQDYAWGDTGFIADLQSRAPTGEPEAELWMGAHRLGPSRFESSGQSLRDAIAMDPRAALGHETVSRFGQLPFLAKVLAAGQPLSIQTHPSLEQARAGFARDNAAGLAVDGPTRTYRDANHKPELICALSPFEAKCGLRPLEGTRELFGLLGPGLHEVAERLRQPGDDSEVLADVLAWLLRMDTAGAASLVDRVVEGSTGRAQGPYAADLAWSQRLAGAYPADIGVVVALMLNHVVLRPGQALFLDAGNLHCYLGGAGVEVMANSDNVVRGGLTSKHVDLDELLAVATFEPLEPVVQTAVRARHTFDVPVSDFSLTRVLVDGSAHFEVVGPEVLLVTQGSISLESSAGQGLDVSAGVPVWVPASDQSYSASGEATLFRVTVG